MRASILIAIGVALVLASGRAEAQTALPRSGWVATGSSSNSGEPASRALDGSTTTRWSTGADQTPGQWFSVDMITPKTFSQVTIDQAGSTEDFPRGFQVFVSNDAVSWGNPVASGSGGQGVLTVVFPTQTARFIGIVQTSSGSRWWSIAELNVYGPGAVPTVPLASTGWVATASATGGSDVPARAIDDSSSTRWTTGVPQANGQWFQVDMTSSQTIAKLTIDSDGYASDYARGYQVFVSDSPTNWGAAVATGTGTSSLITATFAPKAGRYVKLVQTASASYWWSIARLTIYAVDQFAPVATVLPRAAWTATASDTSGSDTADKAIDDDGATRFTTGKKQASGQWFQVDMAVPQTFTTITLDAGNSSGDHPRGFQVFVSNDGVSWGSAIASGVGTFPLTTISFPYQTARHVKIVLTASSPTNWWSLHELNIYGIAPVLLMRNGWVASASQDSALAGVALDGKLATRWRTGAPQTNGQWFQVDMRAAQVFNQLTLNADGFTSDYPRGYQVFASNTPSSWGAPIATGVGSAPMIEISFGRQQARYLRVVQTGSASSWWSISEINLYAAGGPSYSIPKVDTTAAACPGGTFPVGCRSFDCSTGADLGRWTSPPVCGPSLPACKNVCPAQGTALSNQAPERRGAIVQCSCTCADAAAPGSNFTVGLSGCADPGAVNPCQSICTGAKDLCGSAAGCTISACTSGQTTAVLAAQSCDPATPSAVQTPAFSDWRAALDAATSELVIGVGSSQTHVPLSGSLSFNTASSSFELMAADLRGTDFSFFGRQVVSPRLLLTRTSRPAPAQPLDEFGTTSFFLDARRVNVVLSGLIDGQLSTIMTWNDDNLTGTFRPSDGTLTLGMQTVPAPGATVALNARAILVRRPPSAIITGLSPVVECSSQRGATVQLSGSSSFAPSGSVSRYQWFTKQDGGIDPEVRALSSAAQLTTRLNLGPNRVWLNVYDDANASSRAEVTVRVADSIAPTIQSPGNVSMFVAGAPSAMVNLGWPVTSDGCDPKLAITATLVSSRGVPVNQTIADPAHVTFLAGAHVVRWTARDASGNARSIDQDVVLHSDDVGAVHGALGAAPPACPEPPLSPAPAVHVAVHACVIGTRDLSFVPARRVGTRAWADCPEGDDACVNTRLNALLGTANQVWSGTVQFDLAGFKVLADPDPPIPNVKRQNCNAIGVEQYGQICLINEVLGGGAGDEAAALEANCRKAWGFTPPTAPEPCLRGLVLVVARASLSLTHGVGGPRQLVSNEMVACIDPFQADNTHGPWALIDEEEANTDPHHLAHELGHALGLGHGNGLDDDCDGIWDHWCDTKEDIFDLLGLSLMSEKGFSTVVTNPQRNRVRGFAAGTAPNAGPAGLNCPTVTPPDPPRDIGTPPPPKPASTGCGCEVTPGGKASALAFLAALAMALATQLRRRRL